MPPRRPPYIDNLAVYPRPLQSPLPVWVAVGGTPQSAFRTGYLGLPMALATFKTIMDKIGAERGWPPMSRQQFEASVSLRGANVVGSPQQVIDKILFQHELFGHQRFLLQMSVGSVPHKKLMRSIELFATEVAPVLKKALVEG